MKHKKSLLLASFLTISAISAATIIPLCLIEKPKLNSINSTEGLEDWIGEWDTTGYSYNDGEFYIRNSQLTVTASAILNTMALYLNTVSEYSGDINFDAFVNDIIIDNIASSDQTNYTFRVSTKENPILYVLDSPIAGVHCTKASAVEKVNLQNIIKSSNASASVFNSGFTNGTLPSAKLSPATALAELVTRSSLDSSIAYSMPGLNVNQITLPVTQTVGIWTPAQDSYSVLVSPVAQSTYYTTNTSTFYYNITRPSLSTIGFSFNITAEFQDTPEQHNVVTRFRNENESVNPAFWAKIDSGEITLTYGNFSTTTKTLQITAMSGDENHTVSSPITINYDVRGAINLATKVGTGKEQTPIVGMVLILPATFSNENWFYAQPVKSDIILWLQTCTWYEYDPTNHTGADRFLPFNTLYLDTFAWNSIDVNIIAHSGDTTGTLWDVTISAKEAMGTYTGTSHTCVITLAE